MPGNNTTYNVGINVKSDVSDAKRGINDLKQSLNSLSSINTDNLNVSQKFKDGVDAAKKLQTALQGAVNVNTGKLDLSKFNKQIKSSGETLTQMSAKLIAMGPQGQQTFQQLANSIAQAEVPLRKTSGLLNSMFKTLGTTIKYSLSYGAINMFTQSVREAVRYAENLNGSLNNIRIVTGQSTEQMNQFAKRANQAAKELRASTLEYTNASLIYYQQGLSDAEVKERTDATIKMANVTKDGATEVSSYMTAIWNNFDTTGKKLEYFGDVVTALGAKTASSSSEIAGGLEKFASVADTIGLSYEYAAASLATIVAKTRQSEDVVGTALKTIFSRMEGLKLGESLEDGTDLNKYSAALAAVGVNIKEANGELKTMDQILDETGERWRTLTNDQQVALAQSVAGIRQYSQFIALMDNWNDVKVNVDVALDASGTLDEQQKIYEESWEATNKRVQASMETLYSQIINDEDFIGFFNDLSGAIDNVTDGIEAIGGITPIITVLAGALLSAFGPQLAASINRTKDNLFLTFGVTQKKVLDVKTEMASMLETMGGAHGPYADLYNRLNLDKTITAINNRRDLEENVKKNLIEQAKLALEIKNTANDELQIAKEKNKEIQEQILGLQRTSSYTPEKGWDSRANRLNRFEEAASYTEFDQFRHDNTVKGVNDHSLQLDTMIQQMRTLSEEAEKYKSKLNAFGENEAITEFQGKINIATQALEAYEKTVGDSKNKIDAFKNSLKASGMSMEEVEEVVKKVTSNGKINHNLVKQWAEGYVGFGKKVRTAKDALTELQLNYREKSPEEIANIVQQIVDRKIKEAMAAKAELEQVEAEAEQNRQLYTNLGNNQLNIGAMVTGTAQMAMNVGMIGSSIGSIVNQIKEGKVNLSSILMSSSMILTTGLSIYNNLNKVFGLEKARNTTQQIMNMLKEKENGALTIGEVFKKMGVKDDEKAVLLQKYKNKGIIAEASEEVVVTEEKAAQLGFQMAINWQLAVAVGTILAIVGAIAGIVAIVKWISEAGERRLKQLEEEKQLTDESIQNLNQQLETTKSYTEEIGKLFEKFDNLPDTLNKMTKGTREYNNAVKENNEEIIKLLDNFNMLDSSNYKVNNGIYTITEEVKKKIEALQEQRENILRLGIQQQKIRSKILDNQIAQQQALNEASNIRSGIIWKQIGVNFLAGLAAPITRGLSYGNSIKAGIDTSQTLEILSDKNIQKIINVLSTNNISLSELTNELTKEEIADKYKHLESLKSTVNLINSNQQLKKSIEKAANSIGNTSSSIYEQRLLEAKELNKLNKEYYDKLSSNNQSFEDILLTNSLETFEQMHQGEYDYISTLEENAKLFAESMGYTFIGKGETKGSWTVRAGDHDTTITTEDIRGWLMGRDINQAIKDNTLPLPDYDLVDIILKYQSLNETNFENLKKSLLELSLTNPDTYQHLINLMPELKIGINNDIGWEQLQGITELANEYSINLKLLSDKRTQELVDFFKNLKDKNNYDAFVTIHEKWQEEDKNKIADNVYNALKTGNTSNITYSDLEIFKNSSYNGTGIYDNLNINNLEKEKWKEVANSFGVLDYFPETGKSTTENYRKKLVENYIKQYIEQYESGGINIPLEEISTYSDDLYGDYEFKLEGEYLNQIKSGQRSIDKSNINGYNFIGRAGYRYYFLNAKDNTDTNIYGSVLELTDDGNLFFNELQPVNITLKELQESGDIAGNDFIVSKTYDNYTKAKNGVDFEIENWYKDTDFNSIDIEDQKTALVNYFNSEASSYSSLNNSVLANRVFNSNNPELIEAYYKNYDDGLIRIAKSYKNLTPYINNLTKARNEDEKKAARNALNEQLRLSELNEKLNTFQKNVKDKAKKIEEDPIKLTTNFEDLNLNDQTIFEELADEINTLFDNKINIDGKTLQDNWNIFKPILDGEPLTEEALWKIEKNAWLVSDQGQQALQEMINVDGVSIKVEEVQDILNNLTYDQPIGEQINNALEESIPDIETRVKVIKAILDKIPTDLHSQFSFATDRESAAKLVNTLIATTKLNDDSTTVEALNKVRQAFGLSGDVKDDRGIAPARNQLITSLIQPTAEKPNTNNPLGDTSTGDKDKNGSQSTKEPTKLDIIDSRTEKDMWEKSIENLDKVIKLADTEYEMATTLEDKQKATDKKLNAIAQKKIDSANLRNEAYNRYIKYNGMSLQQALTDYAPEIFGTAEATKIEANINSIKTKIPAIGNLIDQMLQTSDPDLMKSLYNQIIPHINEYNTKHLDNQISFDSKFIDTFFNKQSNSFGEWKDAEVRYKNTVKEELDTRVRLINTRKQELEYIEKAIDLQKEYNDILYGEDNHSDEAINATFENIYKGLNAANITLAETKGFINELTELSKNPDINGFTDDMENSYQELANKYFEGIKAIQNYVTVSFEELNSIYDEYSEKIKNNMDYLQSLVDITESYYNIFDKLSKITDPLTGKALFADYNTLVKTRKIQEDFNMAITVQQRDRVREQQTLLQQAAEGLARAQAGNNQRLIKQAQDYYDKIKEQAQEAEEEFISSISEAINKTFENLADSISRLFTETTKDLYAVGGIEDFNKNMELRNQLEDEYLDKANKEYELNKLQRQIQQEISKNNTLLTRTKLGDLMREITEAQKSSTELSKTELTFLQKKYQLRLAEIALEEAQNNKTSMRLVRNSRGQYDYVFTADQAAIDSAQQKLEDAQIDLHNTARDLLKQALTDTNSMLSSFEEEMSSAQTLEEQQEIQTRYLRQLEIYDNRIKRAEEALGPELFAQLMKQYGANETTPQQFINRVTGTINSFATEAGVLAQQATERVSNYARILGSVTEEGIFNSEAMMNKVMSNFNSTEKAIEEDSREMTEKINDVWSHLKTVIDKINKVDWEEVTKHLKGYLDQIASFSEKSIKPSKRDIKDAYENGAMTEAEVAKAMEWSNPSNSSSSSTSNSSSNTNNNNNNSVITGTLDGKNYTQTKNSNGTYTITAADGSGSWTLKKPYFSGETGGYTGDFDGGKWGLLHEKELVLNKEDTSNILEAVSLVRQMAGSILKDARDRANLMRYFTANQIPNFKYPSAQHDFNQNVSIEANFPNVSSAAEIEEALDNLINQSAQYGQIYQD